MYQEPRAPRKFKYTRPRSAEEVAEAIYEQMSETTVEDQYGRLDTLKDYVASIRKEIAEWRREQQRIREGAESSERWALGALAVLAIILLLAAFGERGDFEWIERHRFTIRMLGIISAGLYVGLSIERSAFFSMLWRFGVVKFVVSVAFSTLAVISTAKASIVINGVFGIDATAFPYTRAILAGILFFEHASPVLLLVTVFAFAHGFNALEWLKSKGSGEKYITPPFSSLAFLFLAIVFLIAAYAWLKHDFSKEVLPGKIYRLAHELDFNLKHTCKNLPPEVAVVFIGEEHSKVLVDSRGNGVDSVESLVRSNQRWMVPEHFPVVPCGM